MYIRMIKSRRMGCARTCRTHGEKRDVYRILVAKPEEKRLLEDLDVGRRIILKCMLER
jgi:hypothetical protein